ncbi:MAG: hypothetical protein J5598_03025 [Clostridia bacterium]|nr:hypothetical protein [Clostridia bacterium]
MNYIGNRVFVDEYNPNLQPFVVDKTKTIWFYDCEVFKHDWMFCFISWDGDKQVTIVNNYEALREFISKEVYQLIGYNNGFYDNNILQACLIGLNPYELSMAMINGNRMVSFKQKHLLPPTWDLTQCKSAGVLAMFTSLKHAEIYYYHMAAVESQVDFELDRQLTDEELALTKQYCLTDTEYTRKLFMDTNLKNEYKAYMCLLEAYNLPEREFLHKTHAYITNHLLGNPLGFVSDKAYVLPDNSDGFVPQEVYDFYVKHQHDTEIPSTEFIIAGLTCQYGVGGLHGAIPGYKSKPGVKLIDVDVTSLYPSLMIKHKLFSRNSIGVDAYEDILNTRVRLKREKNPMQIAYKIILNSTYGAMGTEHYDLADPMMRASVCVYGQLFITALMKWLGDAGYKIVQVNTDGVMFEENGNDEWKDICKRWEERTRLGLEAEYFNFLYQRDVNNYYTVTNEGGVKTKGIFRPSINKPPFIAKLLPKMLNDELPDDITEGMEVWDFVHIVGITGARQSLRQNSEAVRGKTFGLLPVKEGYGEKLTLEVVDKNNKRDINRQIPYVTYGWILGENGFPDNWREALDRDAIMDELRNSFSTSGDVYVRLNDSFEPDPKGNRISINPLSDAHRTDTYTTCKNVQRKNLMFEFDHKTYEEQLAILDKVKPIISRAVFTGNKSIHFIVTLDKNVTSEERYRQIWDWYNEHYFEGEADPGTRSSHVYTRVPGCLNANGKQQVLLYETINEENSDKFGGTAYTNKRKLMTKKQTIDKYNDVLLEYVEGNRFLVVRELMKVEYAKYIGIDQMLGDLQDVVQRYGSDKSVDNAIKYLKKLYAGLAGQKYADPVYKEEKDGDDN